LREKFFMEGRDRYSSSEGAVHSKNERKGGTLLSDMTRRERRLLHEGKGKVSNFPFQVNSVHYVEGGEGNRQGRILDFPAVPKKRASRWGGKKTNGREEKVGECASPRRGRKNLRAKGRSQQSERPVTRPSVIRANYSAGGESAERRRALRAGMSARGRPVRQKKKEE